MSDKNRSFFNPNAASFVPNPNAMPFIPEQGFVPPPVAQPQPFHNYGIPPPQQFNYFNPQQFVVHPTQARYNAPSHLQPYNGNISQIPNNSSSVISHHQMNSETTKTNESTTVKQAPTPTCKFTQHLFTSPPCTCQESLIEIVFYMCF